MKRIAILTGAGISAESGLETFRDPSGLWAKYNPDDVATPQGFARNSQLVHEFYNMRRAEAAMAEPNAAHRALAEFADRHRGLVLITQNVDDLHERAGSSDVIHMHGQLMQALCASCDHRWAAPAVMRPQDPCPACGRPTARPDIVWFGEMPYHLDRIEAALRRAELFVTIGTSGRVYPAAGLVTEARMLGVPTLEMNLEPSENAELFDETRLGPATRIVPDWVTEMLQKG